MTELLAVLSGSLVGFPLALSGGGGSILAVPLLLYVVGVRHAHVAIGTSALASRSCRRTWMPGSGTTRAADPSGP